MSEAAARAVELTMRQAQLDAVGDVQQRRAGALGAAEEKAAQLVKTSRPGARSSHARYDPAARLLREWYLTVHAAVLDQSLGGRSEVPGVAAVEAMAGQVARIRTGLDPLGPFRATAFLLRVARADAAAAASQVYDELRAAAPHRAAGYVARHAGVDAGRGSILRHWYQRCYLATLVAELGLQRPLQAVTAAEAREVAVSVELGQFRRIIGGDGIPLVTAHGTAVTEVDCQARCRRDRGHPTTRPSLMPGEPHPAARGDPGLEPHLTGASGGVGGAAAGTPDAPTARLWDRLPGAVQSQLIGHWLDTNRHRFAPARTFRDGAIDVALAYPVFVGDRDVLPGPPETAAAEMFNQAPHSAPTATSHIPSRVGEWFPAPARSASQVSTGVRTKDYRPPPKPNRGRQR